MEYKLKKCEQETIIQFTADQSTANIYSSDPVWIRKIKNMKGSRPYGVGYEADFPRNLLSIRKERILTPEQKAKLSARMKRMREKQVNTSSKKAKR